MIIVMLWRPRGKGHGHASLAVTQPRTDGKGSEPVCVCTWFSAGGGNTSSGSRSSGGDSSAVCFKSDQRSIPTDVWDEMGRFMVGGGEREVFMQGVEKGRRPKTLFKPPSNICRIPTLGDPDVLVGLNTATLLAWWNIYQQKTDYNAIKRNCSTAVAGGLLAAGGKAFAKRSRHLYWTPEKVFKWATDIWKVVEKSNQELLKARREIEKHVPRKWEMELWSITSWKKQSNAGKFSHRYQLMKDIDEALSNYHDFKVNQQKNPTILSFTRQHEILLLGEILKRLAFQRAGRKKSARAAAVLRLGAQVLGRLQVIYDEIEVERQEEAERQRQEERRLRRRQQESNRQRDERMVFQGQMLNLTLQMGRMKTLEQKQELHQQIQQLAIGLHNLKKQQGLLHLNQEIEDID